MTVIMCDQASSERTWRPLLRVLHKRSRLIQFNQNFHYTSRVLRHHAMQVRALTLKARHLEEPHGGLSTAPMSRIGTTLKILRGSGK